MKQVVRYEGQHCANCGIAMQGEFCHACGQSIHSVLKPIHGMLEDTLDIVLHVDSRVVRTLPPLLLRPGFLTLEYFSGRRVRYVAPFRLMFVLSLLAFFVIHLRIDAMSDAFAAHVSSKIVANSDAFKDAKSPAEVREALREPLQKIDRPSTIGIAALAPMDARSKSLREPAHQSPVALVAAPMPAASVAAATLPAAAATTGPVVIAATASERRVRASSSQRREQEARFVHVAWLPAVANARLSAMRTHIIQSINTMKDGDKVARSDLKQRAISGFFGVLPPTMFVLMPLFALLLQVFYLFKRRLYIEHLIVALHSHAFLFLSLLLWVLLSMLAAWVRPHASWLAHPLSWMGTAVWLWAPVYLLIMQKRIYRQSWPLTVVKYLAVGWCYWWMLAFALLFAGLLGLAH